MPTEDKTSRGHDGSDLSVGRTKGGKITVSWECAPETSGSYSFRSIQRVYMTEEEARWLAAELAAVLQKR